MTTLNGADRAMKTLFLTLLLVLAAISAPAQNLVAAGPQQLEVEAGDPPIRAGRLAYLQGTVELRPFYDAEPMPAEGNWPLTSGNVIATGADGRAELRIGSTALRLDAGAELEIAELGDTRLRLRLLQGSLSARVRNPELAPQFELGTAQGRLTLAAPSQIRVDAGLQPGVTDISVFAGAARFDGAQTLTLVAGQRATITSDTARVGIGTRDDFDFWSLARDQRDEDSAASRYLSPETTGYEALDQYGSWDDSAEYGAVWVPARVPDGWAPYRDGRWAWIAPWGWTWIDAAPWGYAPFHYGRWAWLRQRWCWVPGPRHPHPAWAPALVGWVGSERWQARFVGGSAPAVGWFPLAPHDAFVPAYAASAAYRRRFQPSGSAAPSDASYRERLAHGGVTVLPRERFGHGRPVSVGTGAALLDPAHQLSGAPLANAPPPRPPQDQRRRPRAALPAPLTTPRSPVPIGPTTPVPTRPQSDWRAHQPAPPPSPIQSAPPVRPAPPHPLRRPPPHVPHHMPPPAPLDADQPVRTAPPARRHPEYRPAPGAAGRAVPSGGNLQRGNGENGLRR